MVPNGLQIDGRKSDTCVRMVVDSHANIAGALRHIVHAACLSRRGRALKQHVVSPAQYRAGNMSQILLVWTHFTFPEWVRRWHWGVGWRKVESTVRNGMAASARELGYLDCWGENKLGFRGIG